MWQGQYKTITDVPAELLFSAITDINNWSKWDDGLEFTKLEGAAKQGAAFLLKPKGGPRVRIRGRAPITHGGSGSVPIPEQRT